LGVKLSLGISLGNQAHALASLGEFSRALDLLAEQEQLYQVLGNKNGLVHAYRNQAEVLMRLGDLDGAVQALRKRDRLSAELASTGPLATVQQLRQYGIFLPI